MIGILSLLLLLLGVGFLAAGAAVAIRPASPVVVALAGVAAGIGWAGMNPEWDDLWAQITQ